MTRPPWADPPPSHRWYWYAVGRLWNERREMVAYAIVEGSRFYTVRREEDSPGGRWVCSFDDYEQGESGPAFRASTINNAKAACWNHWHSGEWQT